ncbi:MAG: basic secretory protein-like protein [Rubripirellula sp.]
MKELSLVLRLAYVFGMAIGVAVAIPNRANAQVAVAEPETAKAVESPFIEKAIDDLTIDERYVIHFDTTEVPNLRPWVQSELMPACELWYPRIVKSLSSNEFEPPQEFSVTFRDGMRGVAYTQGKDVYCAGPWYLANLKGEATGSVIHELVHVVQQYGRSGGQRPPGWLVEGIADHIRWYQYEPVEKRRKIDWDQSNYDDAYFPSATFLDYIVKNIDPDAIKRINADCRQGRYTKDYWESKYNKPAKRIWDEARP